MSQVPILLPKLGESVAEATIIKWVKKVGETVGKDETIAEVGTDKVDTDLPSEFEGILTAILVEEGETVAVGTPIAMIEADVTVMPTSTEVKNPVDASQKPSVDNKPLSQVRSSAPIDNSARSRTVTSDDKSGLYLTPVVRNIAKEAGLSPSELANIQPTGSNGTRITKKDILHYLHPRPATISDKKGARELEIEEDDDVIQLSRMRKLIAEHMSESAHTAAHVTSWVIVDVSNIVNWREANKESFQKEHGYKLTYTHILMSLVCESLQEFPKLNAWYDGAEKLVLKKDINLGFATATPDDNLIVPNIKNAQDLSLENIAAAVIRLGQNAKTKKLDPNDIKGTTFTISNTGAYGSLMGTPILALPQVAILALGEIVSAPGVVMKDGKESIAIVKQMHLSLSYDHRIIDGAYASLFLTDLKKRIGGFSKQ